MRRAGKTKEDVVYLKTLGRHLSHLIQKMGYKSPYDFWINAADGEFSRMTLNHILNGRMDPKLTTLRAIARLLKVDVKDLFDFSGPA